MPVCRAFDNVHLPVSIPRGKDNLPLVARKPDIEADGSQVLDDEVGV